MPLKNFTDFYSSIEEENLKNASVDFEGAKAQLFASFNKEGDDYVTKNHLVKDLGNGNISIGTGDERSVILKVVGFDTSI